MIKIHSILLLLLMCKQLRANHNKTPGIGTLVILSLGIINNAKANKGVKVPAPVLSSHN